ncbi:MAG TPA: histidine kinase [Streptosporangiaceae bacterium]|nr:histidine kinase [Streptosporangiaceae bacterium]
MLASWASARLPARRSASGAASRARIVATADATRRRIERDLHDGAQQRLVSLVLQLRAVRSAAPLGAGELVRQLDGLATGWSRCWKSCVRSPAACTQPSWPRAGCAPLKALAHRSAVPVRLDVQVERQLAEPVEIAAYYVVAEALTNTAKHAHATAAEVQVTASEGVLHVRVRDDGRGGADATRGRCGRPRRCKQRASGATVVAFSLTERSRQILAVMQRFVAIAA